MRTGCTVFNDSFVFFWCFNVLILIHCKCMENKTRDMTWVNELLLRKILILESHLMLNLTGTAKKSIYHSDKRVWSLDSNLLNRNVMKKIIHYLEREEELTVSHSFCRQCWSKVQCTGLVQVFTSEKFDSDQKSGFHTFPHVDCRQIYQ